MSASIKIFRITGTFVTVSEGNIPAGKLQHSFSTLVYENASLSRFVLERQLGSPTAQGHPKTA